MRFSEAMTQFPRPGWESGGLGAAGGPRGAAARRGGGDGGRRAAALPRGRGVCAAGGGWLSGSLGPVREKRAARGERAAHCGRWRLFRRCPARAGRGRGGSSDYNSRQPPRRPEPRPQRAVFAAPEPSGAPQAGPGHGAGGSLGRWEGLVCGMPLLAALPEVLPVP